MLKHLKLLIELFAPHCADHTTLDELYRMLDDRPSWSQAKDLFNRIRAKTLKAEKHKDSRADCQYLFEEVCAQTLYNFTGTRAPFDPDAPYWIVPNALSLARRLGIPETEIARIVSP